MDTKVAIEQSPLVSSDIYLQAFRDGHEAAGDGAAAVNLLQPLIVRRDGGWARVVTADGHADIYGLDDATTGLMVNHVSGLAAYELIYEIARHAGFVVMPVGSPTCVPQRSLEAHLPAPLAADVVLIESGDDLRRAIQAT